MKTIRYVSALAAVVFIAGCATSFRPQNLDEVRAGMLKTQVVHLLGEPNHIVVEDGKEILHYIDHESIRQEMGMSDATDPRYNGVSMDQPFESSLTSRQISRYVIELKDGVVISYRKL